MSRKTGVHHRGFSLVELLTAIAVISVVAGLAIPYFADMTNVASEKKDQRNAQTIAGAAACASAAGAKFVVAGDKLATVKKLRAGVAPLSGPFKGQTFRVPGIADDDLTRALPYLTLINDELQYGSAATH
jgi:prepilin-type N-terminal cleavage/methylation domain-containing protein